MYQPLNLAPGQQITDEWLSANEQAVYYGVNGALWTATRPSTSVPFGTGTELSTLTTGSGSTQYVVSLTADEQQVFFDSITNSLSQVYSSQFSGSGFGAPVVFDQAVSSANEGEPVIRADGLALYYLSTRAGGLGQYDILGGAQSLDLCAIQRSDERHGDKQALATTGPHGSPRMIA